MNFVDAIRTIVPEEGKMALKGWPKDEDKYLYVGYNGLLVCSGYEDDSCFIDILDQDEIESLDWEVF